MHKYFCLLFLLTAFFQVSGQAEKPDTEDFSKISAKELDEAFIIAIKKGRADEVKKLIEAGANVNQKLTYLKQDYDCDYNVTCTVLEYAAGHGHTEIIKALIQAEPEIEDINHALITAIERGHLDVVKELIQAGADVNYVDKYGNTPLIIAVDHARPLSQFSPQEQEKYVSRWEQRAEIIQTLLKTNTNVNHADKLGDTALMLAIKNYDFNTVQNILQTPGININHVNNAGETALIIAIKHIRYSHIKGDNQQYHICINSQNILEELLKTPGINLFHINKNGETAIDLLIKLAEELK